MFLLLLFTLVAVKVAGEQCDLAQVTACNKRYEGSVRLALKRNGDDMPSMTAACAIYGHWYRCLKHATISCGPEIFEAIESSRTFAKSKCPALGSAAGEL